MQSKTVPNTAGLSTPAKPQPWAPIRPFILERELSDHLDKAFVRLYNSTHTNEMVPYYLNKFADTFETHINPLSRARRIF